MFFLFMFVKYYKVQRDYPSGPKRTKFEEEEFSGYFLFLFFNTASYAAPRADSTVSYDAGIEPRAVPTLG